MDLGKLSPGHAVPGAVGGAAPRTTPNDSVNAAARDARLDPKLVSAAHQFEASLMAELLKPLNADGLFGDGDDSGSEGGGLTSLTSAGEGSGSALMSFGTEALAKALSEKGGMGIARRILDHFEAQAAKQASAAPGAGSKNTGAGTGAESSPAGAGAGTEGTARPRHPLRIDLRPLLK